MRICKDCKWWIYEEIDHGYVCVNSNSINCADWTEKDDSCEEWEGIDD